MPDQAKDFAEFEFDLESAIRLAIEFMKNKTDLTTRRLVNAGSCWDPVEGRQYWVLYWMNEAQLLRSVFPEYRTKGGGGLKVFITSDGEVTYVMSR